VSGLFKGEEGVTTLGCRNASNAVAKEEGVWQEGCRLLQRERGIFLQNGV
jgi:hypothetical protein